MDVMRLGTSRGADAPGSSGPGATSAQGSYEGRRREAGGQSLRGWGDTTTSQGTRAASHSWEGRGTEPRERPGRTSPADTLILASSGTSDLRDRKRTCVVSSCQVCGSSGSWRLIRTPTQPCAGPPCLHQLPPYTGSPGSGFAPTASLGASTSSAAASPNGPLSGSCTPVFSGSHTLRSVPPRCPSPQHCHPP